MILYEQKKKVRTKDKFFVCFAMNFLYFPSKFETFVFMRTFKRSPIVICPLANANVASRERTVQRIANTLSQLTQLYKTLKMRKLTKNIKVICEFIRYL